MTNNNYINIDQKDYNLTIYRIMPIHRLLEIFSIKKLTLVQPSMWDDPFENLLLNSVAKEDDFFKGIRDSVYGQCWTLNKETDAMWRIYSSDKQGVKVKTTIKKLISTLIPKNNFQQINSCFIGKVMYVNQKTLISKLKRMNVTTTLAQPHKTIAESLIYKRKEFNHEKEIRLIYTEKSDSIYQFNINPYDLFDEIIFDPRMNKDLFNVYKESLALKGYIKPIRQSNMYKPPKDLYSYTDNK